jgi:glycerol uptake facilitator-like aquaporin
VTAPLSRRLLAEAIAAALLLATVIGSGIMAQKLAGGNVALALLANTAATAAALPVLILVFGPVSGAHMNPVMTLAFALRGEFAKGDVAPYVGAQLVGGFAGALLAHAMFDVALLQVSTTLRAGPAQWLSEAVATFGLVTTVVTLAARGSTAIPAAVGLWIAAAYWFTASTSFANPAVTFARMFTDTFAGIAPSSAPGFLAGQAAGLAAGLALARLLAPAPATPG